jgi:peptide/nickel transport system substrate-binding protein
VSSLKSIPGIFLNVIRFNILMIAAAVVLLLLPACSAQTAVPTINPGPNDTPAPAVSPSPDQTAVTNTPVPTPAPPRTLTICLGQEPVSLFIFSDQSRSANTIREALYDGLGDFVNYQPRNAILTRMPNLENGGARLVETEVYPGEIIINNEGRFASLAEGVMYRPAGCNDPSCAVAYRSSEPAVMTQMAVQFELSAGINWSDGITLSAADSIYAFEVTRSLYPRYRSDLIERTHSYQLINEMTAEWRGLPGLLDPRYATYFFPPLPKHAWEHLSPQSLLSDELINTKPLGWGAYMIDEWIAGDHISLRKNPVYHRSVEGLPHFDQLVFRFVNSGEEALAALGAGECDLADGEVNINPDDPRLAELQRSGRISVFSVEGTSWEQITFGIDPLDGESPSKFAQIEVRQAVAMCIDRESLTRDLITGSSYLPHTYLPPDHPLYNPEAPAHPYDPEQGRQMLASAGWIVQDGSVGAVRQAQSVPGIVNGTLLEIEYLTTSDQQRLKVAEFVKESLAQCGIGVNITAMEITDLLAAGPEGPIFGRKFDAAQFGWMTSIDPPCALYLSSEIPGPYPDYPRGWGGGNAAGFSNPEYDDACSTARSTLPDWDEYLQAHNLAQAIYAEELPSLPLYFQSELVAARSDFCGLLLDPSPPTSLTDLESFDYGDGCSP